jgi:hemerythrin-like domain-containing protein
MRAEHLILAREFRRLRRAAAALRKDGQKRAHIEDFLAVARIVIQIFVNHIHKENHILFPLVRKFLTKDALREVARRMV